MTYTKTFVSYIIKLIIRLAIVMGMLYMYFMHKDVLLDAMNQDLFDGLKDGHFTLLHILWPVFMLMLIQHLVRPKYFYMALLKTRADMYQEVPHSPEKLRQVMATNNRRAWIVFFSWVPVNILFGILYNLDYLDRADMLMLSVLYFLGDYVCILFWCPFQSLMMKNKCCVTCRIFDWGHIMMFTPMAFIPTFFSQSLFLVALAVLIAWEYYVHRHPERFWEGSNKRLRCSQCQDKVCQIKKKVITVGSK